MSIFQNSVQRMTAPAPVAEAATETLAPEGAPAASEAPVEDNVGTEDLGGSSDHAGTESLEVKAATETPNADAGAATEMLTSDNTVLTGGEAPATQEAAPKFVRARRLGKTHALFARMMASSKLDRRSAELQHHLGELKMIENFSQVALEHHLSAPLVAAFFATPGFEQAIHNFPAADGFNVFPHHATDANNVAGMESLSTSFTEMGVSIKGKTEAVVSEFNAFLSGLGEDVTTLMAQVRDDKLAVESLDLSDDVMQTLPVTSLDNTTLNVVLTQVDQQLKSIDIFDVTDLRANPEKIAGEVESLKQVVDQVGSVFGLALNSYGLTTADKGESYEPTAGNFADKDMTTASLGLLLSKAEGVLDTLKVIADHSNDLTASTMTAVSDMPEQMNGSDLSYGGVDHATLLNSYVTLTSKVIREAVQSVSMVLTTVDAALDIDDGSEVAA